MQDIPQIEAFSIPLHVELTELLGFDFDLVQNCELYDWSDAIFLCHMHKDRKPAAVLKV